MLRFFRSKKDPKAELKEALPGFELPSFPAVASKGLEILRSDTASLQDAAKVIVADPGISTRLLGLVNSASAGLRHPVKNVAQAVTLLGKGQVETLLTAIAVAGVVGQRKNSRIDNRAFWQGAARRAALSRALAKELHPVSHSLSYSAALLQDMAVPLLANSRDSYAEVLEEWRASARCLADVERDTMGVDHAEVAGWLCQAWQLPEPLTRAIVGHHVHDEDAAPIAVRLSSLWGDDLGETEELIERARDEGGIAPDRCEELISLAVDEAAEIAALLLAS